MNGLIEDLQPYFQWLGILSLVTFFISLIAIPGIVAYLPQDFFYNLEQQQQKKQLTPLRLFILGIRNIIGAALVIAGIIMLFLPGQGILTIVIGLLCMAFPGKRNLLLYLIHKPSVQNSLDWTRRKLKRPQFRW